VWQGRFYSCPLDDAHLWAALRYVELNPVRAGMVSVAEQWQWSSAAAHCNPGASDKMLETQRWQQRWTAAEWMQYLAARESSTDVSALRQCTHTGRPLGTTEFVARLEQETLRPLAARKGGRRKKVTADSRRDTSGIVA
jgi:putative transposase